MDDPILIRRTLGGDEKAFEELYERYKDKVFRLSLRILWDREDAMDATQETFVKAYKALGKFRGKASFSTWLYRITYNTAIDTLRKRSRRPETVLDRPDRTVVAAIHQIWRRSAAASPRSEIAGTSSELCPFR